MKNTGRGMPDGLTSGPQSAPSNCPSPARVRYTSRYPTTTTSTVATTLLIADTRRARGPGASYRTVDSAFIAPQPAHISGESNVKRCHE